VIEQDLPEEPGFGALPPPESPWQVGATLDVSDGLQQALSGVGESTLPIPAEDAVDYFPAIKRDLGVNLGSGRVIFQSFDFDQRLIKSGHRGPSVGYSSEGTERLLEDEQDGFARRFQDHR
jgi:hypothetical protein